MKYWLNLCAYGKNDTSGSIELSWLNGELTITPEQQLKFLQDLHDNKLPFSIRSLEIVKKIMIEVDTLGYILRSKTGLDERNNNLVGWYIGYVEKNNNVYYFSTCIQCDDINNDSFFAARKKITNQIFNDLGIIPLK